MTGLFNREINEGKMLNYEDLVSTVKGLPLNERLSLLEILTLSVREELAKPKRAISPAEQIRGMAKPTGIMPTNADLKESYVDYLIEKYN